MATHAAASGLAVPASVTVEDAVTNGSTNAITSNAVYDQVQTLLSGIADKQDIFDALTDMGRSTFRHWDFEHDDRDTLTAFSNAGGGSGQAVSQASTGVNSTENAIGVMDCITGTGTTARAGLISSGNLRIGSHRLIFAARVALSAVSDGTNTYTAYIGFIDNTGSGDMTDGIYYRYTHSVNSGKWEAVTAAATVRDPEDTGVSPVGTVNDVFLVDVNEAGTEAKYYINGNLVHTQTTGLPGTGDLFVYGVKIEKSAGGTSRTLSWDEGLFIATRSSAR